MADAVVTDMWRQDPDSWHSLRGMQRVQFRPGATGDTRQQDDSNVEHVTPANQASQETDTIYSTRGDEMVWISC